MKINLGSVYGLIFAITKITGYNDWSWWYICIGFIIGNLYEKCDCEGDNNE